MIVLVKMENQTLHIDKESVSYEIEMRTRDFGEIKGHLRSITSYRMHPVTGGRRRRIALAKILVMVTIIKIIVAF